MVGNKKNSAHHLISINFKFKEQIEIGKHDATPNVPSFSQYSRIHTTENSRKYA